MLEGADATAAAAAALLGALTLAIGRRFIIVDGAERWKEEEVTEHLVALLESMPADTTIAFFAREEGRAKAPPALGTQVPAELFVHQAAVTFVAAGNGET